MAGEANSTTSPLWAKTIRLFILLIFAAACLLSLIDSARSWAAKRVLTKAAEQAANVSVSTPLNLRNCQGAVPCPVVRAADAAKQSLLAAGLSEAECINSSQPSFSGVLVWIFSCGTISSCDTAESAVCVKVDMTATERGTNGELIPFTRVTVQRPQRSLVASVLELVPGKTAGAFPKSVSASAMVRNDSVS